MVHWLAIASPPIAVIILGFLVWRQQLQQREAEEKYWSPFEPAAGGSAGRSDSNSFGRSENELLEQMLTTVKARLADLRRMAPGPARRCCSD